MHQFPNYNIVMESRSETEKDIEALSDEELHNLIGRAKDILEARANERRKTALAQIRRIARENGLSVSVKAQGRRRGRPPKSAAQAREKGRAAPKAQRKGRERSRALPRSRLFLVRLAQNDAPAIGRNQFQLER